MSDVPFEKKMMLIEWRDANFEFDPGQTDWAPDEDYINATMGWVEENDKWVIIVGEITPGGERAVTRVPKENVVSRKRLLLEAPTTGPTTPTEVHQHRQ